LVCSFVHCLFFPCSGDPRDLPSFPTRRSSDLAAFAGLAVVLLSKHWWLLAVGAVCIAGAWFYTGGKRPYGYAGFGELAVFVFFGPVAVLGTVYVQADTVSWTAVGCSVAVGAFSSAVLLANN